MESQSQLRTFSKKLLGPSDRLKVASVERLGTLRQTTKTSGAPSGVLGFWVVLGSRYGPHELRVYAQRKDGKSWIAFASVAEKDTEDDDSEKHLLKPTHTH